MAVVEYCMLLKRMVLKNSQLAEVAKGKEKKELDRLMRDSKVLSDPSFPSPFTRLVLCTFWPAFEELLPSCLSHS